MQNTTKETDMEFLVILDLRGLLKPKDHGSFFPHFQWFLAKLLETNWHYSFFLKRKKSDQQVGQVHTAGQPKTNAEMYPQKISKSKIYQDLL